MMVSKEEMVDVLKTAAVSRLFVPVCILLLGSPAGLIRSTGRQLYSLLYINVANYCTFNGYNCHCPMCSRWKSVEAIPFTSPVSRVKAVHWVSVSAVCSESFQQFL